MASVRQTLRHVFVWSYERGTLQYDIICALILAFVFFVPRSCFVHKKTAEAGPSTQKTRLVTKADASGDAKKQK